MIDEECKCDIRTKLAGDGCHVCNPGRHDYLAIDAEAYIDDQDDDKSEEE